MSLFSTEYTSDTIVCYLRILTAAILKRDREIYEGFVLGEEYATLEEFLKINVEPSECFFLDIHSLVGVESDQIHIVAMSNAFSISIKVANLDATPLSKESGINYHVISPMNEIPEPLQLAPILALLYRPGHYDILVSAKQHCPK